MLSEYVFQEQRTGTQIIPLTPDPIFPTTLHGLVVPFQSHCHVFLQFILATSCCYLFSVQLAGSLALSPGRQGHSHSCSGTFLWDRDDLLETGLHSLVSLPLNRVSYLLWAEDQGRAWAGMVSSTLSELLFLPLPPPRTGANSDDL